MSKICVCKTPDVVKMEGKSAYCRLCGAFWDTRYGSRPATVKDMADKCMHRLDGFRITTECGAGYCYAGFMFNVCPHCKKPVQLPADFV